MNELLKKLNVLYVEDDDEIRDLLKKVLERKVKNLYIAVDGKDGLDQYHKYKPDIILTDIKMPKMSGIEMSYKIRETNKEVPIIVLSAHSETNYFLDAIECNISGYLLKPLNKEKLYSILEENSKIVLFERNKKEHEKLLQGVIDLQPSIIFSTDEKRDTLFVNKLFLDYFTPEQQDSMPDNRWIYSYLKENNSAIIVNENKNVFWIDYIFENKNEAFQLKTNNNGEDVFFQVKTKFNDTESNKNVVVLISPIELG